MKVEMLKIEQIVQRLTSMGITVEKKKNWYLIALNNERRYYKKNTTVDWETIKAQSRKQLPPFYRNGMRTNLSLYFNDLLLEGLLFDQIVKSKDQIAINLAKDYQWEILKDYLQGD